MTGAVRTAVLEVDEVSVAYRRPDGSPAVAVRGVSLSLQPGRIVGLAGESGCGKSSLALACLGTCADRGTITGGRVRVDGVDLLTASPERLRSLWGRHLAYLPQNPATALHPAIRIGAQLAAPMVRHLGLQGGQPADRAVELLDRIGIDDPPRALRRYPHEFSGGQQQRIALALALSCRPRVLILDEPTTGLDVTTQARIVALLTGIIAGTGTAVLHISHDLTLLATVADRLLVMRAGQIVESGTVPEVMHDSRHPYTRALLAALPGTAQTRPATAPAVSAARLAVPQAESRPVALLQVKDLCCRYRGRPGPALSGVSLEVSRGETVGVVGESGSGKSTLLRAIAGLCTPQAGTVCLAGDLLARTARRRPRDARRQIQLVFQDLDSSLNPRQRVGEILRRPIRLFRGDVARHQEAAAVASALEEVGLPAAVALRYPDQLSGGQRQRVALARAFAARPALLLCDEVTSALDVSVQATILGLIDRLTATFGTAVVFVSHDLAVVRSICRRAVVLRAGVICEDGPVEQIFSAPAHPYTRELINAIPAWPPR